MLARHRRVGAACRLGGCARRGAHVVVGADGRVAIAIQAHRSGDRRRCECRDGDRTADGGVDGGRARGPADDVSRERRRCGRRATRGARAAAGFAGGGTRRIAARNLRRAGAERAAHARDARRFGTYTGGRVSWIRQAAHVFRKDVREWPWQVFVYFVVVSVTVLRAEDRFGLAGIASGVMMMVTTLFGMVFVTMVVQSDSPTRPNAFWGTRPFHSSALLAAKLGFAVVIVIGMAAAGQVIALTGWNVPATTVVRVTLGGAFAYLMWLFAAMTIAALTRDLRSAIVAFLCMLVGVSVVMGIASNPIVTGASARMVHGWGSAIARVLGVAVPVALLAFLYRRRDVRYRAWVAAAVVFVLFFIAAFDTVPSEADARPTGPAVRLRATLSTSPVLREVHVRLSAIDAPANQRLSFFVDSSVVHLSNGTSLHAAGGQRPPVTVHPAMLPTPGAIRWLGDSRNGQYVTE